MRDSKLEREEHLFSTQLISWEKNPATNINHFEGSEPEWLVPKGTLFFVFWQMTGFLRGREGNNLLVHACGTNSLFLFSFLSLFFHFSLIFPFSSFFLVTPCFYFLVFKFSILSFFSPSLLFFLYTARTSFYNACRDWILPF